MDLTDKLNKPDKAQSSSLTNVPAQRVQNTVTDNTEVAIANQIATLQGHFILCGGGRTATHIIERFWQTETPLVLVEHDFEEIAKIKEVAAENNKNLLYVQGDATKTMHLNKPALPSPRD